MKGLCTGSGWHEGEFSLEIRGEDKVRNPFKVEETLSFVTDGPRACVGYRPPRETASLLPCPEEAEGKAQCENCFRRAEILPCLRCDGERCRNPERRSSCVQPDNHAVYLASFGKDMLKVGVARWTRREERIREQGAPLALIIARDDGQMVRRVETAITKLGIPDRYASSQKLSALSEWRWEEDDLREELFSALALIRHRIRAPWVDEPEIISFGNALRLDYRPPLLKAEAGTVVRGVLRGIQGQLLFIEGDEGIFALEAGSLHGYHLRPAAEGEEIAGQTSLSFSV